MNQGTVGDVVKLAPLAEVKRFALSVGEPVKVRREREECCHLLVRLLVPHLKPAGLFSVLDKESACETEQLLD